MQQPFRREKLSSEIVRETAKILLQELRDPRLGFVTVTKAVVSSDMRYAKVFVSIMGDEKKKILSMNGLKHARGFVQKELSHRIKTRVFPEIRFVLDESIDKAFKIGKMIDELAAERKRREAGLPAEGKEGEE